MIKSITVLCKKVIQEKDFEPVSIEVSFTKEVIVDDYDAQEEAEKLAVTVQETVENIHRQRRNRLEEESNQARLALRNKYHNR